MALFEGIGRVSDYAQLNNLRREAKHRVKTGQSLVQAMGAPLQISRQRFSEAQESNTKRDAEREGLIRQKLRNGQKLSPMDKQYLKEKDPDLYDKVARIEERREALERALKRAKSKEEARLAVAQANISVLAEMQRGGGASNVSGAGGGSAGHAEMPAAAANGSAAAAGDALDAPQATGVDAAPTTGDMQGAIGREAVAAQSDAALSMPNAVQGGADGGHADGVQDHSCGAEKDACGNRRTPPRAIACRSPMRGYISCARSSVNGWSMRTPRSTGTSRIRYAMRQRRRHAASSASSTQTPRAFPCILRRVPQRCSPHNATIMRRSAERPSRRRAEQYAAARTSAK